MDTECSRIESWMEKIRRGDQSGLADLFGFYRARLELLVRLRMDQHVAARVDAADVLQETYLDACRQIDNLLLLEPPRAYIWLRGLALQRMMKTVRSHKDVIGRAVGREIVLPDNSSADLARFLIANGATPSRVAQDREMSVLLQQAIGRLKEDDREVIVLRHFEGLCNSEIAEVLGVQNSTATMRYGRALVRLREQLASVLDNRRMGR